MQFKQIRYYDFWQHSSKNIPNSPQSVKNNGYIACIYDSVWWIVKIMQVD